MQLKTFLTVWVISIFPALSRADDTFPDVGKSATVAGEKVGLKLAVQAWTFRDRSLFKTIDEVQHLGLKYLEAYPGQRVDADKAVKFTVDASAEVKEAVKKKLADTGVTLVNFGVVGIPKDEAGARKVFDFAKEMGLQTIVSEPGEDEMPLLDKLTKEYSINVAIHDHPKPSHYWDPAIVMKAVEGTNERIGSCADVGHWQRSGIKPLDAIALLKQRVISSHFKDLNEFGNPKAKDVPWGTGTGDAKAMLEALHSLNKPLVVSIEYEDLNDKINDNVEKCVAFFGKTCEGMK